MKERSHQKLQSICFLFCFLMVMTLSKAYPQVPTPLKFEVKELSPITLAVSNVGNFSSGDLWYLSMNSDGKCVLTIDGVPRIVKRFDVTSEQIEELRNLLEREKIHELDDEYGIKFFDGGVQTLTVTIGAWSKSIKVLNMGAVEDKQELRECGRVLRIHQCVRSWFDNKQAVDFRDINNRVLIALDKEE